MGSLASFGFYILSHVWEWRFWGRSKTRERSSWKGKGNQTIWRNRERKKEFQNLCSRVETSEASSPECCVEIKCVNVCMFTFLTEFKCLQSGFGWPNVTGLPPSWMRMAFRHLFFKTSNRGWEQRMESSCQKLDINKSVIVHTNFHLEFLFYLHGLSIQYLSSLLGHRNFKANNLYI